MARPPVRSPNARIAVEVADEGIQIHGGAGYMKEYGIERICLVI